jgi:hypothetical protein
MQMQAPVRNEFNKGEMKSAKKKSLKEKFLGEAKSKRY